MRISGYLFILEQFACGVSLLLALRQAAMIPRTQPLRLLFLALLGTAAAMLVVIHPEVKPGLLALALWSPNALWPGLPRRLRRRLPLTLLLLLLLYTGAARIVRLRFLPPWLTLFLLNALLPVLVRSRVHCSPSCVTLDVRCGANRAVLTALVDTGNLLRDPLSGLPVIVISRRATQRLIELPVPGKLNPGLRKMSIRTIAGASVMTVFRPTQVQLMHAGHWQTIDAMLGVAPDGYDGVQALVPSSILDSSIPTQGGCTI